MMELFLEGNRVDLSADISSLLTFCIDDIRDFSNRQTTFSKTIVIPGTINNNRIFGNIFELGISNSYSPSASNVEYNFNASVAARAILFQDNLQTFKGTLRLLQINKIHDQVSDYEIALNGELTALSVALAGRFLHDLDFSAYDHFINVSTIEASWDNPGGSGYFYPLIDYGKYSTDKHDWGVMTFRPALYVKEYIDKMFENANFRYSSPLFNTSRFKKFIVPHNQKQLYNRQTRALQVAFPSTITYNDTTLQSLFAQDILGGFTPNIDDTVFTYSGATISGTIKYFAYIDASNATAPPYEIWILKNGAPISVTNVIQTIIPGRLDITPVQVTIVSGDTLSVQFTKPIGLTRFVTVGVSQLSLDTDTPQQVQVNYSDEVLINGAIPQNIRQVDFLTSIVKLFNLYVVEDKLDDRLIMFTPFPDYYSTSSLNSKDWTYKLNRDAPIKIKPMSELTSKIYKFEYKDDSDFWNEQYKKRYNQRYGSHIFDTNYEFASNTNQLELIFASTVLVGYTGEDKVYSTIFKQSNNIEDRIDSVIRILQAKKITGVSSWDIIDEDNVTVLGSYTEYGYAGHLDDPDNPSNDLNFGVPKELFFILLTGDITVNQFNVYWSSYMAEITDKDSKLLSGKFFLTPKDIFELDFSKYIVVDGVLYRLNKILDYNASVPSDCEVELIKVLNTIY